MAVPSGSCASSDEGFPHVSVSSVHTSYVFERVEMPKIQHGKKFEKTNTIVDYSNLP